MIASGPGSRDRDGGGSGKSTENVGWERNETRSAERALSSWVRTKEDVDQLGNSAVATDAVVPSGVANGRRCDRRETVGMCKKSRRCYFVTATCVTPLITATQKQNLWWLWWPDKYEHECSWLHCCTVQKYIHSQSVTSLVTIDSENILLVK